MKKAKETILRQWKILQMIPQRGKIGTSAILNKLKDDFGEDFKVNIRTIQRDLVRLSAIFPLMSDEGIPAAGWSWMEDAAAPDIPAMDPTAALTYKMVEDFLSDLLPRTCRDYFAPQFKRANNILAALPASGQSKWPDKVRAIPTSQPLRSPDIEPEVMDAVYEGLLLGRVLKIQYRRRGEEKQRKLDIHPHGVVLWDRIVYLVGTVWDYDDVRHLALHRMEEAEVSESAANIIEDFNLQEYIDSGAFGYLYGENKINIKVLFDSRVAEHLYERPLSEDQVVVEKDNGQVEIHATVNDTDQLRWWLMGFGSLVEVFEPEELREEFKNTAERLSSLYG